MTLEPILEIRGLKTVFRVRGREIVANPLKDIAGVSKPVLWDGPMTTSARDINISFGV